MPEETQSTRTQGKVISLRGHRVAEQMLDDLLAASRRDPRYGVLVAKLSSLGEPALAAVARRADALRPEVLFALSDVTARYSHGGRAAQALLRVVADHHLGDNRRAGAALLLAFHDFAPDVPPLGDLLSTLSNPPLTIASLLREAIEGYALARGTLLEDYHVLFGLVLRLPPELLYSTLATLAEAPGPQAVSALTVLALHPHPDITRGAIEALSGRRGSGPVASLVALEPNLPVDAAHMVSRLLQKLRLSGSSDVPPPREEVDCAAWLGPIDGSGRRSLVLQWPLHLGTPARLLDLALTEQEGVIRVEATAQRAAEMSPAPGLLSVPFRYGLRVLRESVRNNWTSGTRLPVEYQLAVESLWQYGPVDAGLDADWLTSASEHVSAESEADLLSHEHFALWYLSSPGTYFVAREIVAAGTSLPYELSHETWQILWPSIIRLAHEEFIPEMRAKYATRLRLMSEWLFFAGQHREGALAASAARTMIQSPPEVNLFVLRLVQKGILVALSKLP